MISLMMGERRREEEDILKKRSDQSSNRVSDCQSSWQSIMEPLMDSIDRKFYNYRAMFVEFATYFITLKTMG